MRIFPQSIVGLGLVCRCSVDDYFHITVDTKYFFPAHLSFILMMEEHKMMEDPCVRWTKQLEM